MSEPIPESIPTSSDRHSKRPTKKRALTPRSQQAESVDALFAKPHRDIHIPSTSGPRNLSAPPEIVANVQGSSAGAGSGEFHVYKASRRREYERLRAMDEEVKAEEDKKEAREKREALEKSDKEKTDKNRAKREKARLRKEKMKAEKRGGGKDGAETGKKKLIPNTNGVKTQGDEGADATEAEPNNEGGEVKNADEVGLVIEDDD